MTLTQDHTSQIKVTVHTQTKSVSSPWLITVILELDDILYNYIMTLTQSNIAKIELKVLHIAKIASRP